MAAATLSSSGASGLHLRQRRNVPFKSQPLPLGTSRFYAKRAIRVSAEEKDEVKTAEEPAATGGTFYNDERPLKPKDDLSPEFKKRLKDEYLSLGGSPNTPMGSNYFLWIIVIVSILAVLSWALGYI